MAHFVGSLNLSRFVARLRVERDPTTRSSLQRLLLEEANNLAFNLGQLGSLQREVIEGRARIAIQIAVVETLAANGQDTKLAESVLSTLIDVQKTIEQYRQVIVDAQTLRTRSPPIAGVLLLVVGTGLMLGEAPRPHRCIYTADAIDLTGPCGGLP
jgi:hypothetical protein